MIFLYILEAEELLLLHKHDIAAASDQRFFSLKLTTTSMELASSAACAFVPNAEDSLGRTKNIKESLTHVIKIFKSIRFLKKYLNIEQEILQLIFHSFLKNDGLDPL